MEEPVERVLTSDAEGHIIIPAREGGGRVTWVRGVWDLDVKFRYADYMAPTEDPRAINYMPSNSGLSPELKPTAENLYQKGVRFTRLTPRGQDPDTGEPVEILPNTPYQVRFNRRSGALSPRGVSVSGWPYLRVETEFFGTAEDGDLYVLWAATIAAAAFNAPMYTALRDRLAAAQLAGGRPQSNRIPFDIPLEAEAGQTGLYEYFNEASPPATTFIGSISGTTLTVTSANGEIGPNHILSGPGVLANTYIESRLTGRGGTGTYRVNNTHSAPTGSITITAAQYTGTSFAWSIEPRADASGRCLRVQTAVPSGGPPYSFAGWGSWQTWAVSAESEPFVAFELDFDGGNCGRNVEFSTNAQDDAPEAGVLRLLPCLPSTAGEFVHYTLTPADLWRTHNIAWEYQHKEPYWITISGTSTATTLEMVEHLGALVLRLGYNIGAHGDGPELIANGAFTTDLTGWNTAASNAGCTVTVVASAAVLANASGTTGKRARMRQGVTVEPGKSYLIEFTTSGYTGSQGCLDLGTTSGGYDYEDTYTCAAGTQQIIQAIPLGAPTTLWLNFYSTTTSGTSITIDNVSVKESTGGGTASVFMGIDTSAASTAGTTALKLDLLPTMTGSLEVDVGGTAKATVTLTANTRETHTIPWTTFGTVTHPVDQISLTPVTPDAGQVYLYGAWYDDIVTMAGIPGGITAIGGFELAFPSYDSGEPYDCRFDDVILNVDIVDGPPNDPERYRGAPRNTYKWNIFGGQIAYGMYRGHSFIGYMWLAGWTDSDIVNPDTGRDMVRIQRDFIKDAQDAYADAFPTKHWNGTAPIPGPFMPRRGRPSWEALNQEGVIPSGTTAVLVDNTYNKWYFPADDYLPAAQQYDAEEWYGYFYRALLSCASDYYRSKSADMKTVLDKWIAWFNEGERTLTEAYTMTSVQPTKVGTYTGKTPTEYVIGIIWDDDHWHPPSGYLADGRVRYHYNPIYSYTCIAQAMIFKYWTDGDTDALKWARRTLEYLRSKQFVAGGTASISIRNTTDTDDIDVDVTDGCLVIAQRGEEGRRYTWAEVEIEGDGTGAVVVPRICAGLVRAYAITSTGSGYTWIRGRVVGDGVGATVALALYDQVVGAFDLFHTGWEVWEIFNTLAMLALGYEPGGVTEHALPALPEDITALGRLQQWAIRNTRDRYPMMVLANGLPIHEYGGWDPYHHGTGIENPMIRDTRARGSTWTETTGPAMRAAVYQRLLFKYDHMFNALTKFHRELSGMSYLAPPAKLEKGRADFIKA